MSRSRSTARNVVEFGLARTVLLAMEVLPDHALVPLARSVGRILDRVLKGRRRVVEENLAIAYGESPQRPDPHEISMASFSNLSRSFLELARLPRSADRARRCYRVRDTASWRDLPGLLEEGPAIFAACHLGAYEIGGAVSQLIGIPLTTLVRPLDNPLLENYLSAIRTRFGQRLASNRGGTREVVRSLRQNRSVAVLIDLNMKRSGRVFVDFFGRPAATAKTAAYLARKVERPLIPVFTHRLSRPMSFEIEFGEPLWPQPDLEADADVRRLLQDATREVEDRVRKAPEQWLWTHRRWKTRPGEEDGA